ncbi:hypothetical protein Bbelb_281640 [Branchiostoma belcheri]|nr:hypothetical protein Bbelb_281640 [Branchiostoma belcheri]
MSTSQTTVYGSVENSKTTGRRGPDPDNHVYEYEPSDRQPENKDDAEKVNMCGFAKVCKTAFCRSFFYRVLQVMSIAVAVAALFGAGTAFVMFITSTSENIEEIHTYAKSCSTEPSLNTSIFSPSTGPEVPTVLSYVPTELPDVQPVLSAVPIVLSDVPTELSSVTTTTSQGKSKKLSCPAGETLLIDDAIYGMTSLKVCLSDGLNIKSEAEMSLPIVWKACQGLQHCTVTAINRIFGNPFFDTKKFLWVAYRCFPG